MNKNRKNLIRLFALFYALLLSQVDVSLAAEYSGCYNREDSEGVEICYTVRDDTPGNNGEPIFLLHGGFESSAAWEVQLLEFSQEFKVIAVDSRGHGKSRSLNHPISYPLMAEDLRMLVGHLTTIDKKEYPALANYFPGRTGINIVGWSDGGITAINYCILMKQSGGIVNINKVALFGVNVAVDGLQQQVQNTLLKKKNGDYYKIGGTNLYDKAYRDTYLKIKEENYPGFDWETEWEVFRNNIMDMWRNGPYLPVTDGQDDPLTLLHDLDVLVLAATNNGEDDGVVKVAHMQEIAERIGFPDQYPYQEIEADHFAPCLDEDVNLPAEEQQTDLNYLFRFNQAVLKFLKS